MGTVRVFKTEDASVLASQEAHKDQIHAVAASPTGDHIASASDDGQMYLWRPAKLEKLRAWHEGGYVGALVFSGDGKTLYIGRGDGVIRRVAVETGTEHSRLIAHKKHIRSLSMDRAGKTLLSTSGDGVMVWWDTERGTIRHRASQAEEHVEDYSTADISPDGKWAASGGGGTVLLWRAGTAKAIASFDAGKTDMLSIAWHPTKPLVAWSGTKGRAGVVRVEVPPPDPKPATKPAAKSTKR